MSIRLVYPVPNSSKSASQSTNSSSSSPSHPTSRDHKGVALIVHGGGEIGYHLKHPLVSLCINELHFAKVFILTLPFHGRKPSPCESLITSLPGGSLYAPCPPPAVDLQADDMIIDERPPMEQQVKIIQTYLEGVWQALLPVLHQPEAAQGISLFGYSFGGFSLMRLWPRLVEYVNDDAYRSAMNLSESPTSHKPRLTAIFIGTGLELTNKTAPLIQYYWRYSDFARAGRLEKMQLAHLPERCLGMMRFVQHYSAFVDAPLLPDLTLRHQLMSPPRRAGKCFDSSVFMMMALDDQPFPYADCTERVLKNDPNIVAEYQGKRHIIPIFGDHFQYFHANKPSWMELRSEILNVFNVDVKLNSSSPPSLTSKL